MANVERAAAEKYRLLMIAKLDEIPADRVQGSALAGQVSDGMVEPLRLPCLRYRLQNAILFLQDIGAAKTRQRAESLVAELRGQLNGFVQVMSGAGDVAEQEP